MYNVAHLRSDDDPLDWEVLLFEGTSNYDEAIKIRDECRRTFPNDEFYIIIMH